MLDIAAVTGNFGATVRGLDQAAAIDDDLTINDRDDSLAPSHAQTPRSISKIVLHINNNKRRVGPIPLHPRSLPQHQPSRYDVGGGVRNGERKGAVRRSAGSAQP